MRILILFIIIFSYTNTNAQEYINPEGYYELDEETTEDENGDIWGRMGDIQVKLLKKGQAAVIISGCKGAPSYNSGILHDTVNYVNDKVICMSEFDSTCNVSIEFTPKVASVVHEGNNCGLGSGVMLGGIYIKKRNRLDSLTNPLTNKKISD